MKNSWMVSTASAALAVFAAGPAAAADLPVKAPAPIIPPVFSWTGCYIGAHAGGGTMHDSFTTGFTGRNGETGTGGLAGGQVGCNYQDGNAVFGIEGEGYWSGISGNRSENGPFTSFERNAKNKDDFSIAGRVGLAFDRTLVYGKGGWVWGKFDFLQTITFPGNIETLSQKGTLDGLLLGVGIEHALTRNWTIKLEYNFLDFGSKSLAQTSCFNNVCTVAGSTSQHATKQIFKVGTNYLFNWGGPPLVAKY
jgi:outer membrane immunogenic protein